MPDAYFAAKLGEVVGELKGIGERMDGLYAQSSEVKEEVAKIRHAQSNSDLRDQIVDMQSLQMRRDIADLRGDVTEMRKTVDSLQRSKAQMRVYLKAAMRVGAVVVGLIIWFFTPVKDYIATQIAAHWKPF